LTTGSTYWKMGMVQKGGQVPRQDALFPALGVDWLGASPRFRTMPEDGKNRARNEGFEA
jgi:hypothetical protein